MIFILTKKQKEALFETMWEAVLERACKENGIHKFQPIYNEVTNKYRPNYMTGGLSAELHNSWERDLMVDKINVGVYCIYCGQSKFH